MNNNSPQTPSQAAGTSGRQATHPLDRYSVQPQNNDGKDSPFYKPSAPTISLPKGGGALKGIDEKFSVNAVNGTAGLELPLPLSPGRGGFTPALSVSYNSGSGNSAFGLGWSLGLPSIQRKTDKKLPQYHDAIESDVFLLAGAEDLVPVSGYDDAPVKGYLIKPYQPRIEGLFARIEYIRPLDQIQGWWRVTTRDNITTYYGLTAKGRIADPENEDRIFQWLPQIVTDHKGNVQHYRYVSDRNGSTVAIPSQVSEQNRINGNAAFTNTYLKSVAYCNQTPYFIDADKIQPPVENGPCLIDRNIYQPDLLSDENLMQDAGFLMEAILDYGDHSDNDYEEKVPEPEPNVLKCPSRSDAFSSFHAGFEIRTYRKCHRILMFHFFHELGSRNLVRALEIGYQNNEGTEAFTEADLIVNALTRGYDYKNGHWQNKALPAMQFDYQQLNWDTTIHAVDQEDFQHAPQGLTGPYQWTDFEGEGISGILTEQAGAWFYKNNLGNGHFSPARNIALTPNFKGLNKGSLQWQDLDADGRRQVTAQEPVKGFWELNDDQEWKPFRTFVKNLNIDWESPFTKMLDLNGDGRADALITEDRAWTWYENQGTQGFDTGGHAAVFSDEEKGPVLLLRDPIQSIFLADMNGDGMTDMVRIKNGEICYWPNMGYGKFGAKVSMAYAPVFQSPDSYNPQYLSLADISGTGAADLIYVGNNTCKAWINLSGNAWSEAIDINPLPGTDPMSKIAVLDFLGNGTGCLVWSSPLPQHAHAPLQYIDLMGGIKPYIMTAYHSGTGKSVSVQYKSSTRFYLEDKRNGISWATQLPFPVQCVSTVTTLDQVSGASYTQCYRYRHGYYDHEEREFRGFGYVETKDIDSAVTGTTSPTDTDTGKLNQIPVLTKTWNHTGAWMRGKTLLDRYKKEYHTVAGWDDTIPVAVFTEMENFNAQEIREAHRALKGSPLRQEVYSLNEDTMETVLYSITATAYRVKRIREQGNNRYAVFQSLQEQAISYSCEGDMTAPRISQQLTLATDQYGNVLKSVSIAYPRLEADSALPDPVQTAQAKMHITYTRNRLTHDVIGDNHYRLRVGYEVKTYEIAVHPDDYPAGLWRAPDLITGIHDADNIDFSVTPDPVPGIMQKRMLGRSKACFKNNAANVVLPFGHIESLAIPHEQYQLAYTAASRSYCFGSWVDNVRLDEGGFVEDYTHIDLDTLNTVTSNICADNERWLPSGTAKYTKPDTRFYTPTCYKDPWGNETQVQFWDVQIAPGNFVNYWLLPKATIDARNNTAGISAYDMRLLQPLAMYDINGNISELLYDALGMPVAMALKGKGDNTEGDTLNGLDLYDDFDEDAQYNFFYTNPEESAGLLLKNATWRCVYDFSQTPVAVGMIARQNHYNPGAVNGTAEDRIIRFSYSDGMGRVLMHKAQVAADPVTPDVPRWVGSGRTIYNNKGKAVMQFEPYFSPTHLCEAAELNTSVGVSPRLFYDALGRNYRTELPDGTFTENAWTAWEQTVWDQNDTVLESDWFTARTTGSLSSITAEADAAAKAATHAATPTIMHTDSLARPFYTIQSDGINTPIKSHVELDIQGNRISVTDGLRNTDHPSADIRCLNYRYNMLQQPCYQESIDSGISYTLTDVAGQPLLHVDAAENVFHMEYDILRRVTQKWCGELLQEEIFYGDTPGLETNPEDLNMRGQVHHHCDGAGETRFPLGYDFKGNPKKTVLKLLADPTLSEVDWTDDPVLNAEEYTTSVVLDALNRPVVGTDPGGNETRYEYDRGGALKKVLFRHYTAVPPVPPVPNPFAEYVKDIRYDAKGQRQSILYGNNTVTSYTYDPETYRLKSLITTANSGAVTHQHLKYYYDPVGNITFITDAAQKVLYHDNSEISPDQDYTYDALYRLIKAKGREMAAGSGQENNWENAGYNSTSYQNDIGRNYCQHFEYDAVGNIKKLRHVAGAGSYTRYYKYVGNSNRLWFTDTADVDTPPGFSYDYDERGNMTGMQHLSDMQWNTANELNKIVCGGIDTCYQYSGGQRIRKYTDKGTIKEERIYLGNFEIYRKFDTSSLTPTDPVLERHTLHINDDTGRIAMIEKRILGTDPGDAVLTRYIYSNHLQSAALELNEDAEIISYEEYHPYGTTAYTYQNADAHAIAKRYRYTGKERDEESGLYYHGARYYVPWLCRWCSVDPLESKYAGMSPYNYSFNNPVMFNDPSGADPTDGDEPKLPKGIRNGGVAGGFTDSGIASLPEVTITPNLNPARVDPENVTSNTFLVKANEIATELFNPELYYGSSVRDKGDEITGAVGQFYQTQTGREMFQNLSGNDLGTFIQIVKQLYNDQFYTAYMENGPDKSKWRNYNERINSASTIDDKAAIIKQRSEIESINFNKFSTAAEFAAHFSATAAGLSMSLSSSASLRQIQGTRINSDKRIEIVSKGNERNINYVNKVTEDINLNALIKESGMTPGQAGKFFGWKKSYNTKSINDFDRSMLEKNGWTKDILQSVRDGYKRVAAADPKNPSAFIRYTQLRDLLKKHF